jgi:uncharacterized damage-inducible protein DinB
MTRPEPDECEDYYRLYIDQVPEGDVIEILKGQLATALTVYRGIDEEQGNHRYAPDKWSIKEVLGHVIDTERVFAMRALAFARQDPGSWPGMEQDDYVAAANFDGRSVADLICEFEHLRRSNITLFRSLDADTALRRGMASGFEFTVRAVVYIVAGHEMHHRRVLQERYLAGLTPAQS